MAVKVLIVDDAAFMRMMIKNILGKAGYEIVGEAENGAQAVTKFKEVKPDLVTMDITMPEMDGITAVKEIMKVDKLFIDYIDDLTKNLEAAQNWGIHTLLMESNDQILQKLVEYEIF